MENIEPTRQQIMELTESLQIAGKRINVLATDLVVAERKIKTAVAKLQESSMKEALKEVPVENLNINNSGINIQTLKDKGFNTLGDLSDATEKSLSKISGIGPDKAVKICRIVAVAKRTLRNKSVLRLNDETINNPDFRQMLVDLYYFTLIGNSRQEAVWLSKRYREEISEDILIVKDGQSVFEKIVNKASDLFRPELGKTAQQEQKVRDSYARLVDVKADRFAEKVQEISEKLEQMKTECSEEAAVAAFEANTAPFFAVIENICGVSSVKSEEEIYGLPIELINKINESELDTSNMIATLRNYQEFGTKYILNQKRVLLGDEMGLGKTMQAIAAMAHLYANGKTHFLVVCPVSVMVNWGREIEKHSKLTTFAIHGADREKEFDMFIEKGGCAITTFETVCRLPLEKLTKIDMLTVDEAHYVKNPQAQRTQALVKISSVSDYILYMTGTPLENRVEEMIFLISMLQKDIANSVSSQLAFTSASDFRLKISPVYLRRVREDVLTELPEKTETEEWTAITENEKKIYVEALRRNDLTACRKLSYTVEDPSDSSKLQRLLELCDEAKTAGRKIVIFSFFIEILDKVAEALGDRCFGRITGSIPSEERQGIIDRFADSPDGSAILLQIVAGGVGLNIQCASVVIICEPQWKPSIENQAISRCYRMGQSKSVLVYRLLSEKTVDEGIFKVLSEKSQIFNEYADESEIDEVKKTMDEIMESQRKEYGIEADSTDVPDTPDTPDADVMADENEGGSEDADVSIFEQDGENSPSNNDEKQV